ncbi:MAG: hypothetical protein IPO21_00770 [Bacteroidales bacterium]|nr:hypothetical protein [Bacteroidales bacterium]
MHKQIILISLLLSITTIYSQDFLIANVQQHDLWIGIGNPIFVIVEDIPCGSLIVSSDNGKISEVEGGFESYKCEKSAFIITPSHVGSAKIDIRVVKGRDTSYVGSRIFKVRALPEFIGYVGNIKNGTIDKKFLSVLKGVEAILDYENFPFEFDIVIKITCYSVVIIQNGQCSYFGEFSGNKFSEELKTKFLSLTENDKVIFIDIKAVAPDGIERNVRDVVLDIN